MMSLPTYMNGLQIPGWVACQFDLEQRFCEHGGEVQDPDLLFPIASVTKTFTAHLCLQPQARQYLDHPVQELLPYFTLQDPSATTEITPRDLLCHYSGLAPHTSDWVSSPLSRKAYICDRLPLLPIEGPFKEKHRYSNVMYAVLGQWLEEIHGKTWEELMDQDIFQPLHMHQSSHIKADWHQVAPNPYALSSSGDLERIPYFFATDHHLIAPASEVMSSMSDLARWGQFLLQLDPQDERWRPHAHITDQRPFPEFGPLHYGLGWRLDTVRGIPRYWHSGQCSGYTTLLTLYPEQKKGLAIATHRSDAVDLLHGADLLTALTNF
ncbi:serine hydrolase [Kiritimatiellota bacterium B12222]|nr:serine hydrolase [Kiritimatiellota bacterium B12222]